MTDPVALRALCEQASKRVQYVTDWSLRNVDEDARLIRDLAAALPGLLEEVERLEAEVQSGSVVWAQQASEIARLKAELATRPLPTAFTAALARIAELEGEGT